MLSGTNNLKSVRFFKLVLRYDYSIVLYVYVSGMHNAVVLCVCVCLATLMLQCNSGSNSTYRLSCTTAKHSQYNIMLKSARSIRSSITVCANKVVHQKFNRLSLSTMLNLSVSVDKRGTMRLYNKLHRNTYYIARGFV